MTWFPELTTEENATIDRARAAGWAACYPAYPSAEHQAKKTLIGARIFLGEEAGMVLKNPMTLI
jgi:hypothetical protein